MYEGETEAVILNYMDFARYLADRMANKSYTHEREDLRAEAFLVLVVSIPKMMGHPNPGGFLREAIRGHLINIVLRQYLIRRPDGEKRLEELIYIEDITEEGENEAILPKEYWVPFQAEGEEQKQNIMSSFLLSDIERKIIKLRIDGYTLQEIAIQCQLPYVQTQRILQGTKSRVWKILHGEY